MKLMLLYHFMITTKNWKPKDFCWVKVFRKNLPIDNVDDTKATESTFSAIKRMIRSHESCYMKDRFELSW